MISSNGGNVRYDSRNTEPGDLLATHTAWAHAATRTATGITTTTGQHWPWHTITDRATLLSVPDPDDHEGDTMPIYEGLTPHTHLLPGTYPAYLTTDHHPDEPLETTISVAAGATTISTA